MTLLFDAPPVFELPISLGGDLFCTFVYKPLLVDENNDPVLDVGGDRQYVEADYPDGSTAALIIDTSTTPVTVEGVIAGSTATFHEDKTLLDTVKNKALWRCVLTYDTGLDLILCNGTVARYDGKVR